MIRIVTCPWCHAVFETGHARKIYCSSKCAELFRYYERGGAERKAAWVAKNRDKNRAANRKFAETHRDSRRAVSREYYAKNKDRLRQYARDYYATHLDERIEYARTHEHEYNPSVARAAMHRRRAKILGTNSSHSARDEIRTLIRQEYRCFYCGADVSEYWEIDHVTPVSRGGTNYCGNIVGACRYCNRSKSNKTIMEWRLWKKRTGAHASN